MIEEIIVKILKLKEAENRSSELAEISKREYFESLTRQRSAKFECDKEQFALGKLISGLKTNIVCEVNGKTYCVHYNKKYERAFVVEAISPKEADIKLSVNKLGGSVK